MLPPAYLRGFGRDADRLVKMSEAYAVGLTAWILPSEAVLWDETTPINVIRTDLEVPLAPTRITAQHRDVTIHPGHCFRECTFLSISRCPEKRHAQKKHNFTRISVVGEGRRGGEKIPHNRISLDTDHNTVNKTAGT